MSTSLLIPLLYRIQQHKLWLQKTGLASEALDLGLNTYQAIGDLSEGNYTGGLYNGIQGASNIGSFIGASNILRSFGMKGS